MDPLAPKVLYCLPKAAGEKFRPSNGTEGDVFTSAYCHNCIHEKFVHTGKHGDLMCPILSDVYCYDEDDEEYPKEWVYSEQGWPTCTNWKHWDWGNDDEDHQPPPAPIYDPDQLLFAFMLDEFLTVKPEEVLC